jgi:CRP/FNR family transcriptional regulator, cyclic AMP receptor protein
MYVPVDKRLWRRVLDLAEQFGNGTVATAIPLTQEELAQLCGTTRPTVNRLLRDAEAAGAVALRRGALEVTDPAWVRRRSR